MTKVAPVVVVSLAVLAVGSGGAFAQSGTDREPSSIRANVELLASDALEGRFTGSAGIRQAADHIIAELEAIGASPLPGLGDFRLPFEYTGSARDGGSTLRLETADGRQWDYADSVRGLSFSESATASGPLVFAGYGLVIPRDRRIQLRQLCDPSTSPTRSCWCCGTFRRTARESCARCSRATRVSGSRRPSCAGGGRGAWWW